VSYLARTLKPTSIRNYLNIIRILHLEAQYPNPLEKNFQISNLRKGIERTLGLPPNQKLPVTCEMLYAMYNEFCMCFPADVTFWAACCIVFFRFLRKATLLPVSATVAGGDSLLRGDVEFLDTDSFLIHICKTKTIQYNERILTLPYVACPGSPLCPVQVLLNVRLIAPDDDELPLFAYVNEKKKIVWWTHASFTARLRALLEEVTGYKAGSYSCHSFRRGGASLAFRLGMSVMEIKKRADWASAAVEQYIYICEEQEKSVARDLSYGATKILYQAF